MTRFTIALLLGPGFVSPASAQDEAKRAAMDNAQAELSVCIAYNAIVIACSKDETDIDRSRIASDALGKKSAAAGEAAGLRSDDMAMRLKLNTAMQRQLIQNDCSNMHTLRARYAEECGRLAAAQ